MAARLSVVRDTEKRKGELRGNIRNEKVGLTIDMKESYTGRASMPAWWSKKEVGQETSKLAVMAVNRMELLIKVSMLRSNN